MVQVYFDAGHWLYIEMPDKFNELIQRFAAGDTTGVTAPALAYDAARTHCKHVQAT